MLWFEFTMPHPKSLWPDLFWNLESTWFQRRNMMCAVRETPVGSRKQFIIKCMKNSLARCMSSHTCRVNEDHQQPPLFWVRFCCLKILLKTCSFQSYLDFKVADRRLQTGLIGFQMNKILSFKGLPCWSRSQDSTLSLQRCRFDPWWGN